MQRKRWLVLACAGTALVSLAVLVAACGGGEERLRLEISAKTSISYSTDRLEAVAGQPFTLVFDNQDGTEPHNLEIYTDDIPRVHIAATDVKTGPITQELDVPALDAGEYYFQCSVHPPTMTGTLVVQ